LYNPVKGISFELNTILKLTSAGWGGGSKAGRKIGYFSINMAGRVDVVHIIGRSMGSVDFFL